ncbi:hypothetical protein LRS06_21695 [Hymenobacter sp. J193]|uniref:hypothetical protein n=1 Tax=Hymenobacter sp. J193 TaxID=2898429 RepID=UPI00215121A6|nr:hypothetical protein [Hymenobacter sp. J193]MCR5890344.1 hypothetical protein [Hymenobacter sp. J193]
MVEGAKHAACTLIVLSDLRKKKGAEVSVNVRTSEAREEEIGKFICISHPLITKKPKRRLVPATDEQLVQQLLLKVQEVVPSAQMKWNDKDICWYIVVPKS